MFCCQPKVGLIHLSLCSVRVDLLSKGRALDMKSKDSTREKVSASTTQTGRQADRLRDR